MKSTRQKMCRSTSTLTKGIDYSIKVYTYSLQRVRNYITAGVIALLLRVFIALKTAVIHVPFRLQ